MHFQTSIANRSPVYRPVEGGKPGPYSHGAAQQHFADVYGSQAQQSSVELDRANTQLAGDYYAKAQQAQQQSALSGLGLLKQQRQNAYQRQQAQEGMAYDWMRDMVSGATSVLGGLL
jgi:hypothetical protein